MIILPVIHANGTPRRDLEEQLSGVVKALRVAVAALIGSEPKGRDYYPAPGLFRLALEQYDRRLEGLRSLLDEMEEEQRSLSKLGTHLMPVHPAFIALAEAERDGRRGPPQR